MFNNFSRARSDQQAGAGPMRRIRHLLRKLNLRPSAGAPRASAGETAVSEPAEPLTAVKVHPSPRPAAAVESTQKTRQLPRYNVILLNDNEHSYEYVIQLLRTVFGYSAERGYQLAKEVDESSRAIVYTAHKELAELKRELIKGFGADHRVATCRGSMSAIIEGA